MSRDDEGAMDVMGDEVEVVEVEVDWREVDEVEGWMVDKGCFIFKSGNEGCKPGPNVPTP